MIVSELICKLLAVEDRNSEISVRFEGQMDACDRNGYGRIELEIEGITAIKTFRDSKGKVWVETE